MKNIYEQLVGGIRDYFEGHGFARAVVALSGGIDSAVVVALAVKALGADNVRVLLLPSGVSSGHSVDDSVDMARRAAIRYDILKIEGLYDSAIEILNPIFEGTPVGLAEENLQSRLRMVLTMAVCNKTGALMLNTSNKSEVMVGYGTLYGDTSGAIGVIADLYKTQVYQLAEYINIVQGDIIPRNIIEKAPSAELREGQFDTDSLPEYHILDAILVELVDNNLAVDEIVSLGFDRQTVERVEKLWRCSEFKRKQLPPALEIDFSIR